MRNSCTGRWPVHFFQRLHGVAAGARRWLRRRCFGCRAAPAAAAAGRSRRPSGQTRRRFLPRAQQGAPLWLSPTAGDAAQQLIALAQTLEPRWARPRPISALPRCSRRVEAARGGKRKAVAAADQHAVPGVRRLCRATCGRIPASGSPMSIRSCARRRRRRSRRCSTRPHAPSLSDYVRDMGWMHPFYGAAARGARRAQIATTKQRELLELNLAARARASGGQAALRPRQRRPAAALHVRDGKPVDSMVVVVGKPKCPTPMLTAYIRYRRAQPLLVRAAGPRRRGRRPIRGQAGPQISRRVWAIRSCPTGRTNPTIIDPKTIDWKARGRRQGRGDDPPEAGPAEFHGADEVHVPQQVRASTCTTIPRRELFKQVVALFQRRLRPARGCGAARPLAVRPRPRLGRRRAPRSRCRWPSRCRSTSPI